ncbi:type II secretion system protein [Rugamonas sp. A1-17]|nr:type II secretion system protein [Rugamonas sp. A1-17]
MFLVAILALLTVRALENSLTEERRAKEAELLWVGSAYVDAIRNYYEGAPGMEKTYPLALTQLLSDSRSTLIRSPLRKLYRDPLTGSSEWGIVRNDANAIIGIYSMAPLTPIKRDNFPAEFADFANASGYDQWRFVYQPDKPKPVPPTPQPSPGALP